LKLTFKQLLEFLLDPGIEIVLHAFFLTQPFFATVIYRA